MKLVSRLCRAAALVACLLPLACGPAPGAHGGAAADDQYLTGGVSRYYQVSPEQARQAVAATLRSYGVVTTAAVMDDEELEIDGLTPNGDPVFVEIEPMTDGTTQVHVRVGRYGDSDAAKQFLGRFEAHLFRQL